jgi:hypothetical protein
LNAATAYPPASAPFRTSFKDANDIFIPPRFGRLTSARPGAPVQC